MRKLALASAIAGSLLVAQGAAAAKGDFKLDFTAAEPTSYDHSTGGGAYNDRTINKDVVESLEGSDFTCGDTVTFLTRIAVDDRAAGSQSLTLGFDFSAHSTGQQGVAFVDNVAGESAVINGSDVDSGTVDNGDSTALLGPPLPGEILNGPVFVKPTKFFRTVTVDNLDPGETVVLRTDVRIICNGKKATGNLQARLISADGGEQTIPLRNVGAVQPPPPSNLK